MKKQIYKIGQKMTTTRTCGKTIAGKVYTITSYNGGPSLNGCLCKELWKLISPKKVTKPSIKKVKPQKTYKHVGIHKVGNGYSVFANNTNHDKDNTELVFNTKARLLKWIGEHT